MVEIKINNHIYNAEENENLLEVIKHNNIFIPSLCYLKEINEIGACRLCLIQFNGNDKLIPACTVKVKDKMDIITDNEEIIKARKKNLELIISNHNFDCDNCLRKDNCELKTLVEHYGVDSKTYPPLQLDTNIDESTVYLRKDNSKCILCNKCAAVCEKIQSIGVINKNDRGIKTHIACAFDTPLADNPCIACGQCTLVCPTGALMEKDDTDIVKEALNNKALHTIVATAPAVRVALGEYFNSSEQNVKGKMVSALKNLGFKKVFDINFGADLTIIEEAYELIDRINNNKTLPMFTSCSPGWIKFIEHYYPEMIPNLSTCKSPQEMFGAVIKNYYAQMNNLDPKNIFLVTVMPCVAKKLEKTKNNDIDAVLTTRELGRLIKEYNIDFNKLEESEFDDPLGYGGSVIFGKTGGVMEAALRCLVKTIDNTELPELNYQVIRGSEDIKEATFQLNNESINVAVVSSLKSAHEIIKQVKENQKRYHFIEVMTCPGGCINGGGQPISQNKNIVKLRSEALLKEYQNLPIINSQDNPNIQIVYKNFFMKPGSEIAHKLLHTTYSKKDKY